jgi:predicted lactoylglutathione lyase
MERRLSVVTLGYTDVERSRRFYEALGWTGSSPDGEVVFIQVGPMVVALWDRAKLAADSEVTDTGGWGGITLAHNVGSPGEVDELLAAAERAGGTIARRGGRTDWGGYHGIFHDPDGHAWEVAHNPIWGLNPDGSITLPD